MKNIGSIVGVYAALVMTSVPAVLADDVAGFPQSVAPIDSLDAALQKLGSSAQAGQLAAPVASSALSTPVAAAPASVAANSAPPIASNAYSHIKSAPPSMTQAESASVADSPVLWVYEFSAKWCPSCRKLEPMVEEAAAKYTGFIKYVPINVDKNQELVRKLNIAQIPTVMVVDRNGRTLNRLIGLQQGAQLETILDHYKTQSMASIGSTH